MLAGDAIDVGAVELRTSGLVSEDAASADLAGFLSLIEIIRAEEDTMQNREKHVAHGSSPDHAIGHICLSRWRLVQSMLDYASLCSA